MISIVRDRELHHQGGFPKVLYCLSKDHARLGCTAPAIQVVISNLTGLDVVAYEKRGGIQFSKSIGELHCALVSKWCKYVKLVTRPERHPRQGLRNFENLRRPQIHLLVEVKRRLEAFQLLDQMIKPWEVLGSSKAGNHLRFCPANNGVRFENPKRATYCGDRADCLNPTRPVRFGQALIETGCDARNNSAEGKHWVSGDSGLEIFNFDCHKGILA